MKHSSFLIAALGVLIGALGTMAFYKINEDRMILHTSSVDWRKVNLVLHTIDAYYVDSVDREKVTEAALSAALSALDPHSVYLPPVSLEMTEEELASNFEGIGIQFNVPNDTAVVLEVIKGGPSEKAGLRSGDRIVRVDTTSIAGVHFPQDSMVRRMKGPSGTKVLITIQRDGEQIPFNITRDKIPIHCVSAAFMINDTTGYIRLSKFSQLTGMEVKKAGEELRAKGMKRLIFDLRDNSGGYLDQALSLGNMFLEKDQDIVYMEGLHCPREDYRADGKGEFRDLTLDVLIDENTASSSEIFAGAIQDNGRGRIIGRRSFGKGLVQKPYYFSDNSGIRLTIARFYTPCGRCIQKPYGDEYAYEVYYRYGKGEMTNADSMDVRNGGIVPDVFVPVDTTKVGGFYSAINKKGTAMRFASRYFDLHRNELQAIATYDALIRYLDGASLEKKFLDYAENTDALKPSPSEWQTEKQYIMAQVRALVGRYSQIGENAYYYLYLPVDRTIQAAL